MSLCFPGLGRASRKEDRAEMLIRYMHISTLMVYAVKVEEENMRDREECINKKDKTRDESGQ